jgi:hypothetical protein
MVIRSISIGVKLHLGPKTIYLLLSGSCRVVDVERPLWREEGSVVYDCCCHSSAQSFLCPIPAELMTTFYCPSFKVLPTWRVRFPQEQGGPVMPQALASPFVTSYDSLGDGGSIRTRLHAGHNCQSQSQSQSQSQGYFTTGGLPPISSSWRQAP